MANILQQCHVELTRPLNQLTQQQQVALLPCPNNATTTTNPNNNIPIINGGTIINNNNNNVDNIATPNAMVGADVVATATQPNQSNVMYGTHANLRLVKDVINRCLFLSVKFLTSKADLYFDNDKHSVAQIILTKLPLPADLVSQTNCWSQIQHIVPETLNRKCTSTTFAIKK